MHPDTAGLAHCPCAAKRDQPVRFLGGCWLVSERLGELIALDAHVVDAECVSL
jgi:hypothetical protein